MRTFNVSRPTKVVPCADQGCEGCNWKHYAFDGDRKHFIDGQIVTREEYEAALKAAWRGQ